jgi:cell division protein FtsB
MINKEQEKRPLLRIVITAVLGILLLITFVPRAKCVYDLSQRKARLEAEKDSLIQQQAQLEKAMQEANSLRTVEKIAREQLGMVKQGELVIMPVSK